MNEQHLKKRLKKEFDKSMSKLRLKPDKDKLIKVIESALEGYDITDDTGNIITTEQLNRMSTDELFIIVDELKKEMEALFGENQH